MLEKLNTWLRGLRGATVGRLLSSGTRNSLRQVSGERRAKGPDRRKQREIGNTGANVTRIFDEKDSDKNVLVRNKYHREDSGTHETLKIIDDSIVNSGEETGIDPYNTGKFDRSRNWDKRFRS